MSNKLSDAELKARKAARQLAYRAENPERVLAIEQAYREKNREKAAAWREENRERQRAYFKQRYEELKAAGEAFTPERRAQAAKYYAANKDTINAKHSAYKKANPALVRSHCHTRRARLIGSGGTLSRDIEAKLLILQKGCCANCRKKLVRYDLDHIVSLAKGGANTDGNAQLLCPTCNRRKHAKDPIAFAQEEGRLL